MGCTSHGSRQHNRHLKGLRNRSPGNTVIIIIIHIIDDARVRGKGETVAKGVVEEEAAAAAVVAEAGALVDGCGIDGVGTAIAAELHSLACFIFPRHEAVKGE